MFDIKYTNEILFEMNLVRMDAQKGRNDIAWKKLKKSP